MLWWVETRAKAKVVVTRPAQREIEKVLRAWRLHEGTGRLLKRDVGVLGGNVALVSSVLWLLERLGIVTVGG